MTSKEEVKKRTAAVLPNMQPIFKNNVAKKGVLFPKSHPYFKVPAEFKDLARDNFGLPIPEKDADQLQKSD